MAETKDINKIGIVGSGKMGGGIAQVSYLAGYEVFLVDNADVVEKSIQTIQKNVAKLSEKGRVDPSLVDKVPSKIKASTQIESLAGCDLVIEAVFEDEKVKKDILKQLDELCSDKTVFASNTSSLSISMLASGLSNVKNIIGMHFFNPVPVMPLVEIVKTIQTSAKTIERAVRFVNSIHKKPVVVRDQAGFIVNLLLTPFLFDAVRVLSEGTGTVKEIDDSMRFGCGHPMGPLTLCDMIGLDILVSAGNIMFKEYHDKKYATPPLLKRLVDMGDLGIKTGRGFYIYEGREKKEPRVFN